MFKYLSIELTKTIVYDKSKSINKCLISVQKIKNKKGRDFMNKWKKKEILLMANNDRAPLETEHSSSCGLPSFSKKHGQSASHEAACCDDKSDDICIQKIRFLSWFNSYKCPWGPGCLQNSGLIVWKYLNRQRYSAGLCKNEVSVLADLTIF